MTLPRVSAAAVSAGAALDRAGTQDELEDAWFLHCDRFDGATRGYLLGIYRKVLNRIERQAHQLKLARAY